jgi:hypothetical protein
LNPSTAAAKSKNATKNKPARPIPPGPALAQPKLQIATRLIPTCGWPTEASVDAGKRARRG